MRADARRNYDRILAQAAVDFAAHGSDASLDDIARRAGVGSATLFRHFPSRDALLAEVIRGSVDALHTDAQHRLDAPDADDALREWVRAAVAHAAAYRGLSTSLMSSFYDPGSPLYSSCQAMHAAGGRLLDRAQHHGSVRPELTAHDLFTLVNALGWSAEWDERDESTPARLLDTVFLGVQSR